ncbi:MAG: penicillin amidase family protein [Myxococcales bacterium]|nr:penicillin amidase family protein [Myxococcales bacterium]
MRSTFVVACVLGFVGCSHPPNPGPTLTINPGSAGSLTISGPTDFSAVLTDSTADVTWTVTGGGSLSNTTGLHAVYSPPLGTATATLTASTADGLTATVQISSKPTTLTSKTIPGLAAPVTVQYDAEDIPHIKCQTKIDCLAVQGYIQAHDRLFPMDFLRHVARGKLAEMIGIDGLSQDVQLRTLFTTRAGHRLEDDLVAAMDAQTAALVTAFAGGINAYLVELRSNPSAMPGEYAQLPFPTAPADIASWTPQDTLALARLQQFQLSETIEEESAFGTFAGAYGPGAPLQDLGKLVAWIRAAAPPTEQAHTLSPTAAPFAAAPRASLVPSDLAPWQGALAETSSSFEALRARLRPIGATVGSNNWVISAAKSATHVAMVANDPHLGLQYPPLFHLSVMTSALASDNLDLAGGAFPGIPGALVGRGAHVGWGVTVVGYDVTDLYLEQFLPQNNCPTAAPCVLFKGAPTGTIPVPQTYRVRTATGLIDAATLGPNAPPPFVLIVPQHGPVIRAPDAGGIAVTARWVGQEGNTQDVKAILGLNTATDVDAAMLALKDFSTGAQNWVLADDQGHIAYDPHALVPVRTFSGSPSFRPPWFPLPGDGSAEWGDGVSNCASATATPVPATCWIADSALPQGKDPAKGYYFTANADPTFPSVSDDNSPLAHPPYLSFNWDDSTGFRATRIQQRIEQAIAANGSVSLDDMESIQSDHVSRPGMIFTSYVAQLPASGTDPAGLTAGKQAFADWAAAGWDCPSGLTGSDPVASPADTTAAVVTNSSGCFLFHAFLRKLFTNVFTDDLAVIGQGVNQLQAMKAMIYMLGLPANDPGAKFCNDVNARGQTIATRSCAAQVARALASAYDDLKSQIDADPKNWVWGRVHTIQPVSLLAFVTNHYSPGPYARPGGAFTVDVGTPSTSAAGLLFPYSSGGNVRHISLMDPAKPVVKMQLPGPERDVPAEFMGPDLLGQWVKNVYFDFAFGNQIDAVTVSTQTFN